jgi:hypothetical protein
MHPTRSTRGFSIHVQDRRDSALSEPQNCAQVARRSATFNADFKHIAVHNLWAKKHQVDW